MRNLHLRNTFRDKCLFVIAKTTCALLHFRRTQSCLCLYLDYVGGSRRELQTESSLLNTVFFVIQRRKHCHTLINSAISFYMDHGCSQNFLLYRFYILVFDTYMLGFLFILKAYRISVHKFTLCLIVLINQTKVYIIHCLAIT